MKKNIFPRANAHFLPKLTFTDIGADGVKSVPCIN